MKFGGVYKVDLFIVAVPDHGHEVPHTVRVHIFLTNLHLFAKRMSCINGP